MMRSRAYGSEKEYRARATRGSETTISQRVVVIGIYTDSWSQELFSDGLDHWNKCENDGCTVKGNKASHIMEDGDVLAEPTIFASGSKETACSVCEYEAIETMPRLIATPDNLPYDDVGSDDWYTNAVVRAVNNDYMYGTSYTHFGADNNLTRAEAVFILAKISGDPLSGYTGSSFTDVPAGK